MTRKLSEVDIKIEVTGVETGSIPLLGEGPPALAILVEGLTEAELPIDVMLAIRPEHVERFMRAVQASVDRLEIG